MKRNILLALVALLIMSCSNQEQNDYSAIIKGEVLSGKAKAVKFEWIVENPISGKGETFIAEIDSNSTFSIEIPLERIATGRITVGRFYHDIYLMPGDNFFVSIDADTITYSGKGAEKNNYVYQTETNGLWNRAYYKESNKGELTPAEFLEFLKQFKQKRLNFLEAYMDSVKLQNEFVDFYKLETEIVYESLIQGYPRRYSYSTKIPQDSLVLPDEYIKLKSFSNYVDDSKIVCSDYIQNLRNKLYDKATEIRKADTLLKWNDAIYVALFDSLSGKTREYVLTKWIVTEFSRDKYDSIAIDKFNEIEKGELAQNTFDAALNKFNEKQALIGQPLHQEFSNTMLKDTAGVNLSFGQMMAKYKGKVVYLDFWSMGCGPCRAAMPYSKILKEKLAGEPIEFVYASLDKIRNEDWSKVFEVTFTDKNHYVLENGFNSRLHKFMEINWVPCYMIFDKEGKLIDFNADRPSSMIENAETDLEKTLKQLASK
jgi:thiol-disulfide isomerase/thioredoxin